jgi:hypothetical protein
MLSCSDLEYCRLEGKTVAMSATGVAIKSVLCIKKIQNINDFINTLMQV